MVNKKMTISRFIDIMLFIILGMRIFGINKKVPKEINKIILIVYIGAIFLLIFNFIRKMGRKN